MCSFKFSIIRSANNIVPLPESHTHTRTHAGFRGDKSNTNKNAAVTSGGVRWGMPLETDARLVCCGYARFDNDALVAHELALPTADHRSYMSEFCLRATLLGAVYVHVCVCESEPVFI